MTWPLISRTAYNTLLSERDWLRTELLKALDHKRRVERKEAGMTEVAREVKVSEPMPQELFDYVLGLEPPRLRRAQVEDFEESHRETGSWQTALDQVRARV